MYIDERVSEHRMHTIKGMRVEVLLQNTLGTPVILSTGTPAKFPAKDSHWKKENV